MNKYLSTSTGETFALFGKFDAMSSRMVRKLYLSLILTILPAVFCNVKVAGEVTSTPPFVSPYYYGPNAFPIPDILENTSRMLKIGIAGDYYWGKNNSTQDILLRTNIPLWTKRANLSLWWQPYESYHIGEFSGSLSGDVYVSIDLLLCEEHVTRPSWTMRAALKTASGGGYDIGRYYDCPGYFFDTYFGKTFSLSNFRFRICAGGGFLCWQTDNGQQNDAVLYGALIRAGYGRFSMSGTFSGYTGWQSNAKGYGELVHDRPMSLKVGLAYNLKNFEINAMCQRGLRDYPFTQLQIGMSYFIDILNKQ